MDTRMNNQAGFTLIEVLIAITVFAIGILAVASMQTMATGGNTVAMTTTDLTVLAAQRMEELMAIPFDELVDTNGDGEAGLGNTEDPADLAAVAPADFYLQRDGSILVANIARDVPMVNTTSIRVIATKMNANMDGVVRTVTLESVNSVP